MSDVASKFRCGYHVANFSGPHTHGWPSGLHFVEVVFTKKPRATRYGDRGATIYDHGLDLFEAKASVYVALARWWVERVRNKMTRRDKAFYTTNLRQFIEYVSGGVVRPRLESLADVEGEVADLLRKKEALARMTAGE